PHQPGHAPALGLRAGTAGLFILSQTNAPKESNRMTFTNWLRDLRGNAHSQRATGNGSQTVRKAWARFRPRLEVLEDRLAPALLIVNTTNDEMMANDVLSLREAINVVNTQSENGLSDAEKAQIHSTLGDHDAIQFDLGVNPQTIALTGGELDI